MKKMNENEIFWTGKLNVKNYLNKMNIRRADVFDTIDVKYGRIKFVDIDWAGLMTIEYVVEVSNGCGFFEQYKKNKTIQFSNGDCECSELDAIQMSFECYKEEENLDEFREFYSGGYTNDEIDKLIKYFNDEIDFSDLGDELIDKMWNYSLDGYIEYLMCDYRYDNCNEDDDYDDGLFGDNAKKIDDLFFTKIVKNLSAGYTTGIDFGSWMKFGDFDKQCRDAKCSKDNWWGAEGRVELTELVDDIIDVYNEIEDAEEEDDVIAA